MSFQTIFIGAVAVIIIGFIGYLNYKSAIERGKQMYCDVRCKDEEACDFLENDKDKS